MFPIDSAKGEEKGHRSMETGETAEGLKHSLARRPRDRQAHRRHLPCSRTSCSGTDPARVRRGVITHKTGRSCADGVSVRPAKPGDVDYVRRLSKRVFHQYGPYEGIVTRWFESGATVTHLALTEQRPAGFVMLGRLERQFYLPIVSEVLAIAVEPARWKCGIGHLLMKEMQKRARQIEVETLVLHTATENFPGQRLFRKCGFVPCEMKKAFYPEGQDALMMLKDLF